jgi:hypothetical protein
LNISAFIIYEWINPFTQARRCDIIKI